MPRISTATAILSLGLASVSRALNPVILADTNRDGKVDVEGSTDLAGKETWTEQTGALFLANIVDTNRRCSDKIITSFDFGDGPDPSTPNQELDKCHDAADNVLRNSKYLAALKTAPMADVSSSATGSIAVLGEAAAEKVRVFHKSGSDWLYVAANYTFAADEIKKGLELGIDARDVRRPGVWDGRATVQFSVSDGAETVKDAVALRVAPVLTHHHLQQAREIITMRPTEKGLGARFAKELQDHITKAGIQKPLRLVGADQFPQDHFEAGYTSIPGPDGPVTLGVMIRSAINNTEGRIAFSDMRSDSVGAVQFLQIDNHDSDVDHTGNLETIPPHSHNGKSYPAGRVIMGSRGGQKANIIKFLEAQEMQKPVDIDTTWLYIGHTDEFMQFVPADNKRGWAMMVDDPLAGLDLLVKAQKAGHGNVRALSRPSFPTDSADSRKPDDVSLPAMTIDAVLSRANFSRAQEYAAWNIERNINIVKQEVGLDDGEIFRVPALYYNEAMAGPRPYQPKKYLPEPGQEEEHIKDRDHAFQVYAFYPGAVNGIVLGKGKYLSANVWGPVIDGKDILKEAVNAAYAKANMTVDYIDDWFSHHEGVGEIHCGSNAIRDTDFPWW
ncbi:Protein-arginine deiminase type-2 [Metarhizium brunneum]|uniref:Protein-arginine deiminase type-2 n=1 Tax=Metarhizium brunneum TaxID=500148 RepID=A0A7D5V0R3_9HYPO|nr:Protein-arginine deiminase type-2 [Metarhizium brunneum]